MASSQLPPVGFERIEDVAREADEAMDPLRLKPVPLGEIEESLPTVSVRPSHAGEPRDDFIDRQQVGSGAGW